MEPEMELEMEAEEAEEKPEEAAGGRLLRICCSLPTGVAATCPTVRSPASYSLAAAALPTPGSTRTSSGSRNALASDGRSALSPSGLCSPETSLASSLVEATPTDTVSPACCHTACLHRTATCEAARRSASDASAASTELAPSEGSAAPPAAVARKSCGRKSVPVPASLSAERVPAEAECTLHCSDQPS